MPYFPRLLRVDSEAQARCEIQRLGADPAGVERMAAKMVGRMVKLTRVSCRAANVLKQEMLAIGGDAAVARGSVACSIPETDVLLIGSLKQLRQLRARLCAQPFGLRELAEELGELLACLDQPRDYLVGRRCRLDLARPRIMGILNVTPDSFSDGGRYATLPTALARGRELVEAGADIIDVGGESTRPGARPVSEQEEIDRVAPVIEALAQELGCPLSIDTTKSAVAAAAMAAGAAFINDISGLRFDTGMAAVAAASGAGLFLMHTRGAPQTMQADTRYADLVGAVIDYLHASILEALQAGVQRECLAIDPGICFGKSVEGNLELLRRLGEFKGLGYPILLGTSRKSFIGKVLDRAEPADRLCGTLATVALGVQQGVMLHRVHDVAPAKDVAMMAWAIGRSGRDEQAFLM